MVEFLTVLRLDDNPGITGPFTGMFPNDISPDRSPNLAIISLSGTKINGPVTTGMVSFTNTTSVRLSQTNLSGPLPVTGASSKNLWLNGNQLDGVLPDYIRNATGQVYLRYNKFDVVNTPPGTIDDLDPEWRNTQTVPPTNVKVTPSGAYGATLTWTPIAYQADGGYYEVLASQTPGGPYVSLGTTANSGGKTANRLRVTGLPEGKHYFVVRTFTPAHMDDTTPAFENLRNNPNDLTSVNSAEVSADITCQTPTRLYVKANATGDNSGQNWEHAFTDLQSALNYPCSQNLTEIWVAAGVYKPTSTTARTVSFQMKNNVAIYGGFVGNESSLAERPAINPVTTDGRPGSPSSTTLSGDLLGNDVVGDEASRSENSYHVIYNGPGLTSSAVLDGFVITGGNANGAFPDNIGGGVYNMSTSAGQVCSPSFRNCSFQYNSATRSSAQGSAQGGAMGNYARNSGSSSPQLTNCLFQYNSASAGGAMVNYADNSGSSSPQLTNCSFQNNSAPGGGAMYNSAGNSGSSSPQLTNCSFQNNSASGGGAIYNGGSGSITPQLTNCSFVGNSASVYGGAMYNFAPLSGSITPQLTNCSFQNNSATSGGAMYNYGMNGTSSPVLINSVLWHNGAANIFVSEGNASISVRYSLLEASVTGYPTDPTNLTTTTSPFAAASSVELATGSPAINAGDLASYTAVGGPATDLAGNPRIVGGQIDMGAVEFQGTPCTTPELPVVKAPLAPVAITTPVTLTISYTETNVTSATITWGDATADQIVSNPAAPQRHTYAGPGVYTISVRIGNYCGLSSAAASPPQYVVVYDPSAGFVTGGGWIDSPVVSTTTCGSCTFMQVGGKANFGFESKYQKGRTVPTGNTEFKFKAGGLDFRSTAYEWLVVAGSKAQFKGTGSVNGQSGYGFMLTATDGDLNKTKGPDRFRIKIWQTSSNQTMYDNQYGADDTADPSTQIGGGSIVIHDPNGKNARQTGGLEPTAEGVQVVILPNPVEQTLVVEVQGLSGKAQLTLVDVQGRQRGSWWVEPVAGVGHLRAEVGHLSTGVYLLQVETPAGVLSRRRVLKR
ncbi:hypothetical protein GCM10023189_14170 [Nibrella saemangeumensis]|uniref:Por secretion system C-terminal sorting domain-containing protein n=2 Tax=Nibrella saemangeumensis TaxID=1084526 RepID=A0ABP8MM06_9BACT